MKGAGKIVILSTFAALMLLLYVHEQISLFHISYEMESKAERLTRLSEEYRQLRFEVEQLKAPRLLENKIKELSLNLTLPQEVRVVRMPAIEKLNAPVSVLSDSPVPDRLFNLLGRWVDIAQAKEVPQNKTDS